MARGSSNNKINTKVSEQNHHDVSVIAKSLDLSHKNVAQIAFVLENGSDDVKNLLLNECNIIYECRVCLSMFRSFGNFVAHKRLYCKGHECERMVLYDPSWFKPKIDEKTEITTEKIAENSNNSIQPEKTFTNPTKYLNPNVQINSNQAIKSPTEVTNKKRKQNSVVDSNVNSFSNDQNKSETNEIAPSSFYSNEPTQNTTISNNTTFAPQNDNIEKKHQNSSIQSKSLTRQICKKITKTSIRQQKASRSFKPCSSGSTANDSEAIKPQNKLSSLLDTNIVDVELQVPKNTETNEPVIIHRHFHHSYHLPEPIIFPTSNSVIKRKICTKKSKRCPIPEQTGHNQKYYHNPIELINID